jgi:hypothetical protein
MPLVIEDRLHRNSVAMRVQPGIQMLWFEVDDGAVMAGGGNLRPLGILILRSSLRAGYSRTNASRLMWWRLGAISQWGSNQQDCRRYR